MMHLEVWRQPQILQRFPGPLLVLMARVEGRPPVRGPVKVQLRGHARFHRETGQRIR